MGNVYFDEKQRKKRRWILKLKIYGSLSAFFILIIGIGYLIVYSSIFKIQQVNIKTSDIPNIDDNNFRTSDVQELIGDLKFFLANQSKIAGFLGSDNILIWKQEKIGEFLKNEPKIAELTIEKDYFKRLIKIKVKERGKFGIWCENQFQEVRSLEIDDQYLGGRTSQTLTLCWWFDKNGIIFAEAPALEGQLIAKIDDFSGRPLNFGDKILEEKFLLNLIKIFEILEKSGLKIKSLKLKDIALQEIITDSSPKIYFSLRIDPGFALAAFQSLKNIGLEKIEYIDLRVENRAYYKLK